MQDEYFILHYDIPHLERRMRRLPVYLLIDTSGSMNGEPISSVNNGLQSLIATLKQDPFALESVCISIITFDREVKEILPLTELEVLQAPQLIPPPSGPTLMGKALEVLMEKLDRDIIKNRPDQKGDWRPLLFVLTDGKPSDKALYKEMAEKLKKYKFAAIVACAAGQEAQTDPLKLLTNDIYSLATMDGASFSQFFKWVSQSIAQGSTQNPRSEEAFLPQPPAEMNIVF